MAAEPIAGRTAGSTWRRGLRRRAGGETAGAVALLAAAAAALVWANVDAVSYGAVWTTPLSVRLGDHELLLDLREWVNGGLMTFFFFLVGLEARREFDLGELRERSRFVLPLVAGMTVPVALYLAITAGTPAAGGWGVAMSTDTALALGLLALVGTRSTALRSFLLTVVVVDDIVALAVVGIVYSENVEMPALLVAVALLGLVVLARALGVRHPPVYVALGIGTWLALLAGASTRWCPAWSWVC